MKVFFDTEFLEDGKTIEPISIAMVREDGATYLACVSDSDWARINADKWLAKNVIPHLPLDPAFWKRKEQIREDVVAFCGDAPEFWADYASYDWIVMCQLFGKMIELPKHFPMFCNDIQQFKMQVGMAGKFPFTNEMEHDALCDAFDVKHRYEYLQSLI